MDIRELKTMDATRLVRMAGDFQIENAGVLRRQELVYRIIQAQARRNGHLVAEGVLERVQEGYGFLRALEASYLPGPDDVFVSAQQIRRFGLMTGDAVTGQALLLPRPHRYRQRARTRSAPRPEDLRPPDPALPGGKAPG